MPILILVLLLVRGGISCKGKSRSLLLFLLCADHDANTINSSCMLMQGSSRRLRQAEIEVVLLVLHEFICIIKLRDYNESIE